MKNFSKQVLPAVLIAAAVLQCSAFSKVEVKGKALPGAVVVSCTGELAECDENGMWKMTLPVEGMYAFKAMADDCKDSFAGGIIVPTNGLVTFSFEEDKGRCVVRGRTERPCHMTVVCDGEAVRAFDAKGFPIGGRKTPKGMWHQKSKDFFSWGDYAYTMKSNQWKHVYPDHPEIRKRGWFKGDFHAHIIHGENFYTGNVQLLSAIARAQSYDWLYFAERYSNDGVTVDEQKLCEYLSDDKHIFALNSEYPKNMTGHFASIGAGRMMKKADPSKTMSYEYLKKNVFDKGGVAVPVHPLYHDRHNMKRVKDGKPEISWMINKEMFLWLACNPEMCPVLDLFYNPGNVRRVVKFWGDLLDRGYKIAASGTSDASFDVGRTVGTPGRPATFVKVDSLSFENVVEAFKRRCTFVSFDGAGLIIDVDGKTSGDTITAPVKGLRLKCEIYDVPGKDLELHIVRGGRDEVVHSFKTGATNPYVYEMTIDEDKNSWVLAYMTTRTHKNDVRAAASPVYFRTADFIPPEVLPFPEPFPERLRDMLVFQDPEKDLMSMEFFDEVKKEIAKHKK